MPIPIDREDWVYSDNWVSYGDDKNEVLHIRINLVWDALSEHEQVEYIIVYGKSETYIDY